MARLIGIVGNTGTGKTTSLFPYKDDEGETKGLKPEETVIISVTTKPLPSSIATKSYPLGKKLKDGGRYFVSQDPVYIATLIKSVDENFPNIKNIVIDDAAYLQGFAFMDRADEKSYEKFTDFAVAAYTPLKQAELCQRKDLNIIFMYHYEENDKGSKKIRTVAKATDKYLNIDGLFTFLFYTNCKLNQITKKVEYSFETQNDGANTGKTPRGCFKDFKIPNDMGLVIESIDKYYNS